MKTIEINGREYKIRYAYRSNDGKLWYVLNVDGGFYGEYGDEYPVKEVN